MCTIKFDYNIYFGSEVYEMSMKINLGAWNSIFAVPSSVVDEGLKFATQWGRCERKRHQ